MNVVAKLHSSKIHGKRISSLLKNLADLVPQQGRLLDVGCGDGLLASLLAEQTPQCQIQGIDVLVRSQTKIPVQEFDGSRIPMDDNSVDAVMMIDVLHHTDDPEILVREARRVARQWLIIKDHNRNGFMANSTLRLMDWVGNAYNGVALPYNYLSKQEWNELFDRTSLAIETYRPKLGLYGMPGDLVFGRDLHFVARLDTSQPEAT